MKNIVVIQGCLMRNPKGPPTDEPTEFKPGTFKADAFPKWAVDRMLQLEYAELEDAAAKREAEKKSDEKMDEKASKDEKAAQKSAEMKAAAASKAATKK